MEYLREEVVEKEEETETATVPCRIGVGDNSDKTETPTPDVEVSQPVEAWTEQERKVSWVDRIKTIGKLTYIHIFTNLQFISQIF